MPFIESIKVVKMKTVVVCGQVARAVQSKDGVSVDAYCVAYFKVTDPAKSTYCRSEQGKIVDSERLASSSLGKLLRLAVENVF
jgi:regulator of protease activity HflC (stomatin/prohibitin superfamily)